MYGCALSSIEKSIDTDTVKKLGKRRIQILSEEMLKGLSHEMDLAFVDMYG
jgi:hypothetical protein